MCYTLKVLWHLLKEWRHRVFGCAVCGWIGPLNEDGQCDHCSFDGFQSKGEM